ncbi:MAG: hypothetical protein AAFX01_10230 [Cyanobacteria bacterium J06638_28]
MRSKYNQTSGFFFRRGTSSVTLAATFLLASAAGSMPSFGAAESSLLQQVELPDPASTNLQIAQVSANSILYFDTQNYVVNVYTSNGQTLMNVYDAFNDLNRLFAAPTRNTIQNGRVTYISTGSFSGRQATYSVVIENADVNNRQARLVIEDGSGSNIANEPANSFSAFRLPDSVLQGEQGSNTILRFDTSNYSVHVFDRGGPGRFMNVFNRFTGVTEVNGGAASLAPNEPPYEQAVSYVSSATTGGQPVRYFARIDNSGQTVLEVFNVNNQRIFQQFGEGAITFNIPPEDLPPGVDSFDQITSTYVAAVFGDDNVLNAVKRLYPNAFREEASQGSFINVGLFPNRDAARSRVFDLRSQGFQSRVLFRDVDYR